MPADIKESCSFQYLYQRQFLISHNLLILEALEVCCSTPIWWTSVSSFSGCQLPPSCSYEHFGSQMSDVTQPERPRHNSQQHPDKDRSKTRFCVGDAFERWKQLKAFEDGRPSCKFSPGQIVQLRLSKWIIITTGTSILYNTLCKFLHTLAQVGQWLI